MTNTQSKPLFTDDKLIQESLTAAVRMTRLGKWRREMEKYEALKAKHPLMWKRLFDSDHEDDDEEWDEEVEALLTEEYTKFWDLSEKIINAGGMRMYEVKEILNYGKKNQLKYEEGQFKVLYA